MSTPLSKYNKRITSDFLVAPGAEDQTFDRKSFHIEPTKLAETLVAFANADGGTIAIGIKERKFQDMRKLSTPRRNELIQAAINFTSPAVRVTPETIDFSHGAGKSVQVLLLHVEQQSEYVHKTHKDEVFLRVGDESRKLRFEERLQLEYDRGTREYEVQDVPDCTRDDIDLHLVQQWAEHLGYSGEAWDLLTARGLVSTTTGVPRVAGVLLFARNPTMFFPNARIRFIRYDGHKAETGTRMNVTKESVIEAPLPRAIAQATDMIGAQLRSFSTLNAQTGKFETVPEYPEFAWQEGLVNAVTHRAYNISGADIQVRMFDDRLEIESPGKLPGLVRLTNMKDVRFSRNPRIAQVLNAFGYVREFGEGVNRIYEEMKLFHLDEPVYEETDFTVKLTLKNNIVMRRLRRSSRISALISENEWHNLPVEYRKALELAYTHKRVYTREFAEAIGRTRTTARKILDELTDRGFLESIGTAPTDPTRHYRLATDDAD